MFRENEAFTDIAKSNKLGHDEANYFLILKLHPDTSAQNKFMFFRAHFENSIQTHPFVKRIAFVEWIESEDSDQQPKIDFCS